MNSESKKLKRGLKDLSHLFQKGGQVSQQPLWVPAPSESLPQPVKMPLSESPPKSGIQIMSIFCPDMASDALFLNTYLATRIASAQRTCSILSLHTKGLKESDDSTQFARQESYGHYVKRIPLTWNQFLEARQHPLDEKINHVNQDHVIFLDFDYPMVPDAEKIFTVLDKWILILQPSLESITEAYRLIKESQLYRSDVDYFMLYDGSMNDPRGEQLYEKMSELVERRMGIQLNWLGYLDLSQESRQIDANLRLDHLFIQSIDSRPAPEKWAFAELVQKLQDAQTAVA